MTREEIEELKGLAASMGLYDDKKPCKRAVILGKAIKELEQDTVSKESYDHEYFLRRKMETQIDHLHKYISKLETQIVEQEPKSEWTHDHEILKAYADGANNVLEKIRAEIKHFMYHVNPNSSESDYACNYILNIIDKLKGESEG